MDDLFLLEAYREVDAMLPDSPPIAPKVGEFLEVRSGTDLDVYARLHASLNGEDARLAFYKYRHAQWLRGR